MNLLPKSVIARVGARGWGKPCWEQMPCKPGDSDIADLTGTYLGRLVPLPRAIRLSRTGSKLTLVNGCRYPKLPHREPAGTVIRRGKGEQLAYLGVDPSRHPWRDLGSILALSSSPSEGGAWVLAHLAPGDGAVDLWAGGLAANKGKVLDVAEWCLTLPLVLVGATVLNKYEKGVELAEGGSGRLRSAIGDYFGDLAVAEFRRSDKQSRDRRRRVLSKALASYWHTLDNACSALIETAQDPAAELAGRWYSLVRSAMNDAYERACPHESPRQIRAFARGKQRLRLKKPE